VILAKMIKEYKLKKTDARKKHKKYNSNGNANGNGNKKTKKNIQKGGNVKSKDNFEVTTLDNVNYKNFSVSRYVNANVEWGLLPQGPPVDCSIM
jgi:hypothetical protein